MISRETARGACLSFALLLLAAAGAEAQLQVGVAMGRMLYIRYEPLLVTVSITNLSGRPILLSDRGGAPWFSLQVEDQKGLPVRPRVSSYGSDPVAMQPGETLRRTVNITPLYKLDDFGRYTVRATVFEPELGRYFSSGPLNFEITDGRVLWQETVGHPDDGSQRQLTLLSHRLPNSTALYLRIIDPEANRVYCTHRLGSLVTYGKPEIELDSLNRPHILQMRAPRSFIYSHIGLNGEVLERKAYEQTQRSKPSLQRAPDGSVSVVGGAVFSPEMAEAEQSAPTVSDRPVPLPAPDMAPVLPPGSSPTPKPKRPVNFWPFGKRAE